MVVEGAAQALDAAGPLPSSPPHILHLAAQRSAGEAPRIFDTASAPDDNRLGNVSILARNRRFKQVSLDSGQTLFVPCHLSIHLVAVRVYLIVDASNQYGHSLQTKGAQTSARALSNRVRSLSSLHHTTDGSEHRVMGRMIREQHIAVKQGL